VREWITGRNPVYETLRAQRREPFRLLVAQGVQEKGRLSEILKLASSRRLNIEHASRDQLDRIAHGNQGVALEVSGYPYSGVADILQAADRKNEKPFILILDTLQDPQNFGSLVRTAEAVGVHGVILPLRRTATVTPAVVQASSGASEHLLIAQANLAQSIASLQEAGVWVIGLEGVPEAEDPLRVRLDGAIALVVGSEGEGMRPLVRQSCDVLMRLPMRGKIGSLNAAVAGSIALYLVWQTRRI
jgi:23S rRNA (guanosine2251-2'-O)-methyltransferase